MNGNLDPLTIAEIEALRGQLDQFASLQRDPAVQSYCFAISATLAETLERDDPMLRELLTASIDELEKALRAMRLAKETTGSFSEVPLTMGDSRPSFINPIIFWFHGCA